MIANPIAWVLVLLMLLVPAGRVSELSIAGRTPDLFYVDVVMLLAFVATGLLVFQAPRLWRAGWRPLLLFFAVVLVGGLQSPDLLAYLGALRPVFWAVTMVVLATRLRSERQARLVLFALVIGVAIVGLEILVKVGLQGFGAEGDKGEIELDWGRSNYFATFAVVSAFVSYGLTRSARGPIERAAALAGLVAALVLLVLTKSRAAMLAAMVAAALIAPMLARARDTRRRRSLAARLWIVWLPLSVAALYLAYPFVVAALGYDLDNFVDSGNLRRIDAWLSALEAFRASPVWGIGWSNATVMLDTLTETGTTTHSLPLQLLAETGVLGAAAMAVLLWRALGRTGSRPRLALDRRLRDGLRLAVIGALLHCLVEPSFWGTQFVVVFWLLLTLLHDSREVSPVRARVPATGPSANHHGSNDVAIG